MKKNKLTNLLKLGILFFGISLLLIRCEKEDLIPIEVSSKIIPQKISLSQAKKDKDFMLVSQKFKLNNYLNENNHAKSTNNFTIDFSSFYKIKKANYTSYTFLLKRNNKDNSITENLVIEKRNDTVRGYIVKYSNIFYKKSGTDLFLNATTSRTYFKGDIEELLLQNNIEFHNKGGWSCSWNTTYTPRTCSVHGEFNEGNSDCGNYGKSNWTSSSYQTCSYNPTENTLSESSGHDLDFGSGGGGGGGSSSSETVPIIPCANGDENFQYETTASDCIEILEEEELDFDEQIFVDENFKNNPCLKSVYDKIGKASKFKGYLQNFEAEFSVAHLRFSSSTSLPSNTNAETSAPQNYLISITFNENKLDRPSLSIARTMIHEIIHAEIFRKLLSVAQHPSIQLNTNQVLQLRNDYPGLYDYYMRWKWKVPQGQTPSSPQHEAMAEHYRKIIKQALKEFDSSQPEKIYDALSWTGLMGSGAFNSTTGLYANSTKAWINTPQNQRLDILNTISLFNTNNPKCK